MAGKAIAPKCNINLDSTILPETGQMKSATVTITLPAPMLDALKAAVGEAKLSVSFGGGRHPAATR